MGRPRADSVAVATPERILLAAEAEFGRLGFGGARLADIARTAGITRPSLLYHFATKEALYAASVERSFSMLGVGLTRAMAEPGSFAERIVGTVRSYARFLAEHPAAASVFLRELLDGHGPGRELIVREVTRLLRAVEVFVLREGRGAVRPGLPIRAAIMQVASDILLRSAAGPLRDELWGPVDHAETLARKLLLKDEP